MNDILHWLSAGDLRSDGLANEVVEIALQQPDLVADLMDGLDHPDAVVRGHTADALEKIGRSHPEYLLPYLPRLITSSQQDPVAMVRMHLAMLFGHLAIYEDRVDELVPVLLVLLDDKSVFTASWAIASLCIFGGMYEAEQDRILRQIARLAQHKSVAIRTRVKKAIVLLTDDEATFPPGWIKSEHLDAAARRR
jgi:HEAT repeat protein